MGVSLDEPRGDRDHRGMKRTFSRVFRLVTGCTLVAVVSACASSTLIQSQPTGAKLYLNGEPVGNTPYTMTDTKMIGSITTVRLESPGYETASGAITRNEEFNVGPCIGGMFVLVPFLWMFGYKATHTFELKAAGGGNSYQAAPAPYGAPPAQLGAPPAAPPAQPH
jgi:hypothetical protein